MNLDGCFKRGLLRETDFPEGTAQKEVLNAKKHIQDARKCIEQGMFGLAVVSIYTSMFHAGRALLFRDGIKERSHLCVMIYLKEKYPELEDYAKVLDNYRKCRHEMLYGIDVQEIEEDATYGVDLALRFIEAVEEEGIIVSKASKF